MLKDNEEVVTLIKKRRDIEKQLEQVTEELLKAHMNQFFQYYAIDFKENNIPLPHSVRISFEDVYDDQGGYDKHLEDVLFYDKDQKLLELDFIVEIENQSYDEEMIYAIREYIMEKFDVDDLANCLGEKFMLLLR